MEGEREDEDERPRPGALLASLLLSPASWAWCEEGQEIEEARRGARWLRYCLARLGGLGIIKVIEHLDWILGITARLLAAGIT